MKKPAVNLNAIKKKPECKELKTTEKVAPKAVISKDQGRFVVPNKILNYSKVKNAPKIDHKSTANIISPQFIDKEIIFGKTQTIKSPLISSSPRNSNLLLKLNRIQTHLSRGGTPFKTNTESLASDIKKLDQRLEMIKTPVKYREIKLPSPNYEVIADKTVFMIPSSPELRSNGDDLPLNQFKSMNLSDLENQNPILSKPMEIVQKPMPVMKDSEVKLNAASIVENRSIIIFNASSFFENKKI